jgi:hypothetical protein
LKKKRSLRFEGNTTKQERSWPSSALNCSNRTRFSPQRHRGRREVFLIGSERPPNKRPCPTSEPTFLNVIAYEAWHEIFFRRGPFLIQSVSPDRIRKTFLGVLCVSAVNRELKEARLDVRGLQNQPNCPEILPHLDRSDPKFIPLH